MAAMLDDQFRLDEFNRKLLGQHGAQYPASRKRAGCRRYVEALCRRSGEYYARWLANLRARIQQMAEAL